MTADPYVRDRAGKFARLPAPLYRDCPPIPEPKRVPDDVLPPGWSLDPSNAQRVILPAPARCPHGSFVRWAKSNCCKESRRAR